VFGRSRKGSIDEWLDEFMAKGKVLVGRGDLTGLEELFAQHRMQAQWNNPEHEPSARTRFDAACRELLHSPVADFRLGQFSHRGQTRFSR
jgi:hypothetical protein